MTRIVLGLALFSSAVFGLAAQPPQPPKPDLKEIEERAIQAREKIQSAEVHLRIERNKYEGGVVKQTTRMTATIWVSGTKIRADVIRDGGTFAGFRTVDCLNCDKDGWGIRANDKPQIASSVFRLGPDISGELSNVIDPRIIGYIPTSYETLRNYRLDTAVGRPDRDEPVMKSERLEGLDCWAIRWTNKNGARMGVWICPSQGYNVVRIEARSPAVSKTEGVQSVSSELRQVHPSGIWFPRRVIYEGRSGSELYEREVIDVTEVQLNGAIPPESFTLEGIKLRRGAYISSGDDPKKNGFWDPATQIITPPTPPANLLQASKAATPVEDGSRSTNYWLVAACVGLSLAAIAVILIQRRHVAG